MEISQGRQKVGHDTMSMHGVPVHVRSAHSLLLQRQHPGQHDVSTQGIQHLCLLGILLIMGNVCM